MKTWAALGALLLVACGQDCAQVPCSSYVQINFSSALTEPGRYQFDVVADQEKMTCAIHIPAHTDDACDDALGMVRPNGEGLGGAAGAGGAATDPDALLGIGVIGVYDHVSIVITRADDELASDAFEPDYQDDDSCGGCPAAEHELLIF